MEYFKRTVKNLTGTTALITILTSIKQINVCAVSNIIMYHNYKPRYKSFSTSATKCKSYLE